jgi:transcription-repair coupling factor (superfamily II helicase)
MRKEQTELKTIIEALAAESSVVQTAKLLTSTGTARIKHLAGSARSAVIAALWSMGDVPFMVVVSDDRTVDDLTHDLEVLLGKDQVNAIHSSATRSISDAGSLRHDEVDALIHLHDGKRIVIVISAAALPVHLPSAEDLDATEMTIKRGDELHFSDFVTQLALNGFERTDYVGKPGEMAVRGGILDLYPGGWDNPLRLEFWGDTIDSIREFEPLSQRSIREHQEVQVLTRVYHDDDPTLSTTILDHLPKDAVVVLDGPEVISAELHAAGEDVGLERLHAWTYAELNPIGDVDVQVQTSQQPSLGASIEEFLRTLSGLHHRDVAVHVGADGQHNVKRMRELCESWVEVNDEHEHAVDYQRALDRVTWHASSMSQGFVWQDAGIAVLSEHQVFGRQRSQRRSRRAESGITLREIHQLNKNDYVVHADKGIGQFDGIKTIEINNTHVDCVKLLFAGGDILYVHLNYVHKLSKFAAEEGSVPKLSKLGSAEWDRKKARAKKKIKDIARDLIKLYAERKSKPGFAYPGDSIWQKEFEAAFQYEDTPDQAKATNDVKFDMEQPTPMDRLVCGDVGFGKTEVAIRAAFKAAQSGKQVAVLVPTTILAQQHYVTFKDRLGRYPMQIDVLSRFRSKAEQKDVLQRVKEGKVDILIGTHRILSKDVEFRQLGLLIIDEEQRFGVSAKEKLRQVRASVDTLTLTATPIPRTLNFSLMGARDLSIIETPPRNRLPIKTEILEWDDQTLREALDREHSRGGQVFVVTDKIHDMDKVLMRIKMLAPTLRVAMAHGQMPTEELEDVMEGFLERKTDILIATKIIESGLDIPNANTMIINNADNFGLAELYQLRGRVGRSNTQAYCYLVIPPVHTLTRVALRRLQALEEYTDLGSGFQLAMRDLEIRGAGNLLGGEQSGFIMEMGFEMYQKIVDQAVSELKAEEFNNLFQLPGSTFKPSLRFDNEDVAIELDEDALLPASWIPADTDRYDAYKRLYNAHDASEVDVVFSELRDRFGAVPRDAEALRFAVLLRIAALPTGLVRVRLNEERLLLELPPESDTTYYEHAFPALLPVITGMKNARFDQKKKRLFVDIQLARRDDAINVLHSFAHALSSAQSESSADAHPVTEDEA